MLESAHRAMAPRKLPAFLGALGGLVLWAVIRTTAHVLPPGLLFPLTFAVFTFGPGAIVLPVLTGDTDPWDALAVAIGVGFAIAPLSAYLLATLHAGALFAPLAFASAGAMAVVWRRGVSSRRGRGTAWPWYLALTVVFLGISAFLVHARLATGPDGVAVFGGYDMEDVTYYAAIVGELAHTVPPRAPFLGGAPFIYSYYPHLLLALAHVFTGVPVLDTTVRFGWPAFTLAAVWAAFALFSRLASRSVAAVAAFLVFTGEGFAYVAAYAIPKTVRYDTQIWSSLFMAPSATWIYFNTWTAALAVLFAALWLVGRESQPRRSAAAAALAIATLLMFKVFAYAVIVPALGLAAVVCWLRRDRPAAGRLAAVSVLAVLVSLPWLYWIASNGSDTRTVIQFAWLDMPHRMLLKGTLMSDYAAILNAVGPNGKTFFIGFTIVTAIFFLFGLGVRCLGLPAVWRSLLGRQPEPLWTVLAWAVVVGLLVPTVVTIIPHPDELQPYQLALFLLWPFTIAGVMPRDRAPGWGRWALVAVLVAAALPVTIHYFAVEDEARHEAPLAALDADDLRLAAFFSTCDPETTVILHSHPGPPSLLSIVSERRVALGWAGEQADLAAQRADAINRFFSRKATAGPGELAQDLDLLARYRVTYVVERLGTDRIQPGVLSRLVPVFASKTYRLWQVPAGLRRAAAAGRGTT